MRVNECVEGREFSRKLINSIAAEDKPLMAPFNGAYQRGLERKGDHRSFAATNHDVWYEALRLASSFCRVAPLDSPLRNLAESDIHITAAEVPNFSWFANRMKIRDGCHFIAGSSAFRDALYTIAKGYVYLNIGDTPGGVRDIVLRLLSSMVGNIRLGRGWIRNVNLVMPHDDWWTTATNMTVACEIFIVLHELAHIALAQGEAKLDDNSQEVENNCDRIALRALLSGPARIRPTVMAAAIDLLMATQATLEEANWWTRPDSHPTAASRRKKLAYEFSSLVSDSADPHAFNEHAGKAFPLSSPIDLAVLSNSSERWAPPSIRLSQSVSSQPAIFERACPNRVWPEALRLIDEGEEFEDLLRIPGSMHYATIAKCLLNGRQIRKIRRYVHFYEENSDIGPCEVKGSEARLGALQVAGQLVFHEQIMFETGNLDINNTSDLLSKLESIYGRCSYLAILALLFQYRRWQLPGLPLSSGDVREICHIMGIQARTLQFHPESDKTLYELGEWLSTQDYEAVDPDWNLYLNIDELLRHCTISKGLLG